MSIVIRVEHGSLPLQRARITRALGAVLRLAGKPRCAVGLLATGDAQIEALNRTYRKKNKPTDVLSFVPAPLPVAGDRDELLGDIVISLETAARDAAAEGEAQDRRFVRLAVHGLLHLLGYDHHGPARKAWSGVEGPALAAAFRAAGVDAQP